MHYGESEFDEQNLNNVPFRTFFFYFSDNIWNFEMEEQFEMME